MTIDSKIKNKIIIAILEKRYSVLEMANLFDISRTVIYKWLKYYNKFNKIPLPTKIIKSKITAPIKCYIRQYVISRINFDYKLLIANIKRKYNITISKSSIYSHLSKMNITLKKISKRFILTKKRKLKQNKKEFERTIKGIDINKIISIDETSIDTHLCSNKGWSPKGQKINVIKKNNRIRYTVISAISSKKFILYKIIKGSANGKIFLEFIKELLAIIEKDTYILLDNARIHHFKDLKKYLVENESMERFIYNVPYSPEYNPIEKVFSIMKNYIKKRKINNSNIISIIEKSIKLVKIRHLTSFYKKSLKDEFC